MNNPLVSIVTVSYNAIATIEQTILSVINQSYTNIEYSIIDGGSTDGTIDIIKKYADKITYWISEPDGGIYHAMNKGINIATGEWIHFRNCGDYFFDSKAIEKMFSSAIDNEVMILHGDCRIIYSNGYKDKQPPILYRSYKKGMPIFHPSTFVRLEYHKKYPFNLKYKSSSDYEFIYKSMDRNIKLEYRPIIISIYNAIEGYSVTNWKMALKEIWDWKYPPFFLKKVLLEIYLLFMEIRKFISKKKKAMIK